MATSIFLRNICRVNVLYLGKSSSLLKNVRQIPVKPFVSRPQITNLINRAIITPVKQPQRKLQLTNSHTTLWIIERAVSIAILGVIPAAFILETPAMDMIMATTIVMHVHWGLEAIITDYVRPIIVGPIVPKIAHATLIVLTILSLAGFYHFIYNDVGIAKAYKQFWAIKGAVPEPEPVEPEPPKKKGKK